MQAHVKDCANSIWEKAPMTLEDKLQRLPAGFTDTVHSWNKLIKNFKLDRVKKLVNELNIKEEVQERCRTLADETGAVLMQTSLPYSKHFRPSFADGKAGICTLHYPRSGTLGRLADSLGKELHEIISRLCSE